MPPIDQNKINAKLGELNRIGQAGAPHWIELQGLHALTLFQTFDSGQFAFNPTVGFPIKSFMNTATGEVKIYSARIFAIDQNV